MVIPSISLSLAWAYSKMLSQPWESLRCAGEDLVQPSGNQLLYPRSSIIPLIYYLLQCYTLFSLLSSLCFFVFKAKMCRQQGDTMDRRDVIFIWPAYINRNILSPLLLFTSHLALSSKMPSKAYRLQYAHHWKENFDVLDTKEWYIGYCRE